MGIIIVTGRNCIALLISALITYGLGSAASTIFVLRALPVKIPVSTYLETMLSDVKGLTLYLLIILLSFIIAFPIAAIIRRNIRASLPRLASYGYPLAGATAIGTALGLMYYQFGSVPISGANNALGFIVQLLIGACGGFIFRALHKPLKP